MTDEKEKGLYLIICNTPKGIAFRKNKVYTYNGALQAIRSRPTNRDGDKWVMHEITELKKNGSGEMNEAVFECNWLFRRNDGWLYGYKYKPALSSNQNIIFPEVIARPIPGDKGTLIKEIDNTLSFVPKNKLMHISELIKREE